MIRLLRIKKFFFGKDKKTKVNSSKFIIQIIKKWEIIVVSLLAIFFGLTLLIQPDIFVKYQTYEIFRWWFKSWTAGSIFVFAGAFKLFALASGNKRLQHFALYFLVGVWLFSGASFHVSSTHNTIFMFNYANAIIAVGNVLKEALE